MKIIMAGNAEDLRNSFQLLWELRPHLTWENFMLVYEEAHTKDQFELVGFYEDNILVGLIGFRFLTDFVRGRHLYIDDLVTRESKRSSGLGKVMLDYAIEFARTHNCPGGLRLCAGLDNHRGIKFYEKNGWNARAYAFVYKFSN